MTSNGGSDHAPVALTIRKTEDTDKDANGDLKHQDYDVDSKDVDSAEEEEKRDEVGILMEGKKQIQLHNGEVLEVGRDPRPPNGESGERDWFYISKL